MSKTFRAATWNVFYGTDVSVLEPLLKIRLRNGVTLFLMQECNQDAVVRMLRKHGLAAYRVDPEYVVAWVPDVWHAVELTPVTLSSLVYYREGGAKVVTKAARVLLKHKPSGKTLDALSYHLPSHVQVPSDESARTRREVLKDAMGTLSHMGRVSPADAVLYGGDDNVDEKRGFGPWRFMRGRLTGLRLVTAPSGTHGDRKIDDFRTKRLKVGRGYTRIGGGDHRVHIRDFSFR